MKAQDIMDEYADLQRKMDEINTTILGTDYSDVKEILQRSYDNYQNKAQTFLDSEFRPLDTTIYITATPTELSINSEETSQLTVMATLSNGTSKNVTDPKSPMMLFRDFDRLANNVGYITSVDISGYVGEERSYNVIKTSKGFDVDDDYSTQGLQVSPTANSNEYQVVTANGTPLGLKFVTNGAEVVGDNWSIDVYWASKGTIYIVDDPDIATVSDTGLVTAHGGGSTTIRITSGSQVAAVPIQVTDNIPPEVPEITSIGASIQGAEITFEPSVDSDLAYYTVYVNGTKAETDITDTPTQIILDPADGVIEYTITMTATDTSGNESAQSNAVKVVPFPTEEVH